LEEISAEEKSAELTTRLVLTILTLSDLPDRRLEPRHPDKLIDECFRRRKGRIEHHRGHP
jgi:hypothetical protein